MKRLVLATIALSLLGSCEKSRVDVMAASNDELISRCIDEKPQTPEWNLAKFDLEKTRVAKHADGFDIICAFTKSSGQHESFKVVVACPADPAVPCSSFKAQ